MEVNTNWSLKYQDSKDYLKEDWLNT